MAKKKKTTTKTPRKKISFSLSKQQKILLGSFLFLLGIALLFSFVSYFFTWQADQSEIGLLSERELQTQNWLNKFGANVAHFFIYDGFGISAFILASLVILTGVYYFFDYAKKQLAKFWFWGLLLMLWISVFFGFFGEKTSIFSGIIGYETNDLMQDYMGFVGAMLVMIFVLIIYLVVRLKLTPEMAVDALKKSKKQITSELASNEIENKIEIKNEDEVEDDEELPEPYIEEKVTTPPPLEKIILKSDIEGDVEMEVETATEEEEVENKSEQLVKDFGEFDPTLELSKYKFPSINLLRDHTVGAGITIDQEELEENKNKIVETLNNYKIGISSIKATVGPTVTLYEIVPDAGVRISKIKNLEDDIALSLSALGIRIIAPIPGRGTIGIEVPNKNPKMVSMRSVIASAKFQNAEMELPIAFGKTISNETFVVDLAKMPHMLMAGATGQGKSVGLNAVLTSLLYKKHPAEVKFVLVDPKKVELTLFNKIERHYLAKLPDTEEAIITDTNKVINTLNSLCIEMDARYDLLKDAMVRNIKEYNTKFKNRKLNPNEGHRFLPYIILVIDEFADLIMTAGKEVETPIARLAQLARAIGIHLIVATQRPSVNVITGIIKANFPARIAFRVTSKIDSRTILDNSGADQLIGRGDMLFTQGNELTRIQCAFVDTPEVADITDFIGSQKAYPDAYLLPEYVGEEGGTNLDNDIGERDKLFREAAEVLVIAQQGSASLLQRKLKLGYNRAGRIIDQMEAAGIVGPFEGSKARQVTVPTIDALNQLLDNETNNN
ncbi:DNA segregation ATPase, FtsK/SpoIIIE family [Aequorivita sublithincola DSM 14238]|uniref:DNA segregation ATPase, FtsK/SpoIIIE family n=1 Tax=Aequorivita sublithincola (strain DSM 14238 / LMG 21431 / ACAM 643 / 9-3) TaxID=746697 RepID=I3YZT4_AEQSU|nr:DNA translocase FtsK [Aequorivita sublithincola]AFL82502.1 DNA segregation ATPase, FtsK/SpoIIIE family [Aequorivita sublithincola DSM 14238]